MVPHSRTYISGRCYFHADSAASPVPQLKMPAKSGHDESSECTTSARTFTGRSSQTPRSPAHPQMTPRSPKDVLLMASPELRAPLSARAVQPSRAQAKRAKRKSFGGWSDHKSLDGSCNEEKSVDSQGKRKSLDGPGKQRLNLGVPRRCLPKDANTEAPHAAQKPRKPVVVPPPPGLGRNTMYMWVDERSMPNPLVAVPDMPPPSLHTDGYAQGVASANPCVPLYSGGYPGLAPLHAHQGTSLINAVQSPPPPPLCPMEDLSWANPPYNPAYATTQATFPMQMHPAPPSHRAPELTPQATPAPPIQKPGEWSEEQSDLFKLAQELSTDADQQTADDCEPFLPMSTPRLRLDDDDDAPEVTPSGNFLPMNSWSVEQVAEWLPSIGVGHLSGLFRTHRISGDVLPELSNADLVEMSIHAVGDRKKLLRAIAGESLGKAQSPSSLENSCNIGLESPRFQNPKHSGPPQPNQIDALKLQQRRRRLRRQSMP